MLRCAGLAQLNAVLAGESRDASDAMSFTSLVEPVEVKCRIRQHVIRC
jgi:hypothetical protein